MIVTMLSVSLIYQYWLHTEAFYKFPRWIEFIFNTRRIIGSTTDPMCAIWTETTVPRSSFGIAYLAHSRKRF